MSASLIVDAHQHIWDIERNDYPWLTEDLGPIHRTIRQDEVEGDLEAAGVNATVLVQAMDSFEDTDYMLETADAFPRVAGVVGWVPLDRPSDASAALDRYTRDKRFVGVRHLIHNEDDEDWIRRSDVQGGLDLLAERGLTFDLVAVTPRHLEHATWLAERHPNLSIVIDHLGKPPIADEGWQPWADLLAAAGRAPNVFAKVSGLNTAAGPDWSASDLRPYVEHAVAAFGPSRLMYGGDWPIALLAGTYSDVWRETNDVLNALLGPDEVASILGTTAVSFYGLQVPTVQTDPTSSGEPHA